MSRAWCLYYLGRTNPRDHLVTFNICLKTTRSVTLRQRRETTTVSAGDPFIWISYAAAGVVHLDVGDSEDNGI